MYSRKSINLGDFMIKLKVGDIVARKSYGSDILFKIVEIKENGENKLAVLKGICYRLEADAPETDLIVQSDDYKMGDILNLC